MKVTPKTPLECVKGNQIEGAISREVVITGLMEEKDYAHILFVAHNDKLQDVLKLIIPTSISKTHKNMGSTRKNQPDQGPFLFAFHQKGTGREKMLIKSSQTKTLPSKTFISKSLSKDDPLNANFLKNAIS